jgi:hypothetical protein
MRPRQLLQFGGRWQGRCFLHELAPVLGADFERSCWPDTAVRPCCAACEQAVVSTGDTPGLANSATVRVWRDYLRKACQVSVGPARGRG